MSGRQKHKMEIAVPISYWPHRASPLTVEENQIAAGDGASFDLGDFDLWALEEALTWRERWGGKVTVLLVGPEEQEAGLREALSLGADAAVRLGNDKLQGLSPGTSVVTARLLAAWIKKFDCPLIICGDKSYGGGAGLVGPYLAHFLRRPVLSGVVATEPISEKVLKVSCRSEKGSRKIFECPLPAVLSVGRGAKLRYPTLPARLAAQQATIPVLNLQNLGLDTTEITSLASLSQKVRLAAARPKPKKIFTPDSSLSAADRMKMILSGGVKKKKNNTAEINQDGVARIYNLLNKEGLV